MKLIILNGPSGAGKSTLAEKLHQDIPLSVLIEIDAWRRFISGYKKHTKESLALAYGFSLAAVEACLKAGHSVIIDKAILSADTLLDSLHLLGEKYGADTHEFLITATGETLLKRAEDRGFEPNSLLTVAKVKELAREAEEIVPRRPLAAVIDTEGISSDAVYDMVKKAIFKK
jgi:predicted kinase